MTKCKYLASDNRCRIYYNRPKVCEGYTTDECEYDSDWTSLKRSLCETPDMTVVGVLPSALLPRARRGEQGELRQILTSPSLTLNRERPRNAAEDLDGQSL